MNKKTLKVKLTPYRCLGNYYNAAKGLMIRCLYNFGTETQCRRLEFPYCCIHKKKNNKRCVYCKQNNGEFRLSKCGDLLCVSCFAKDVYEVQWFSGFTYTDPIFCPCCLEEVASADWISIIRILISLKYIQPDIIFKNNVYKIFFIDYQPPEVIDISHRIILTEHVEYI